MAVSEMKNITGRLTNYKGQKEKEKERRKERREGKRGRVDPAF